ncbi:MAG: helix-turn-helix transcriptional regulator [Dokdonella sp.]|nr:helix-turn-helix transcriptional regulator [Dokdonella sp.]
MIEYQPELDGVFHALSDPTRRAMLRALATRERCVGELAAPFEITLAAASKHIKTLERAGLVKRTVQGRTHLCALDAAPLAEADAWLRDYARFWTARLDAQEALLREDAAADADDAPAETLSGPRGAST